MTTANDENENEENLKIGHDWVFVKHNGKLLKIMKADILFLEAEGDYTSIVTAKGKYLPTMQLARCIEYIDHKPIKRIHKSYAANIDKIDVLDGGCIIVNGTEIPVSREFLPELKAILLNKGHR